MRSISRYKKTTLFEMVLLDMFRIGHPSLTSPSIGILLGNCALCDHNCTRRYVSVLCIFLMLWRLIHFFLRNKVWAASQVPWHNLQDQALPSFPSQCYAGPSFTQSSKLLETTGKQPPVSNSFFLYTFLATFSADVYEQIGVHLAGKLDALLGLSACDSHLSCAEL